ncbi:1-acyl-sn-glycerol-3-phosphate acyltransferase CHLREDRAFT_174358, partial [Cyclospora cayetanensis]|uniref:1-acyl-sn-glycerol-3-phosphate acyltransferase CHLREDRAFT_174358 n=1 Tax=Cyclospora cayetanensis TaxID=88456 RepID=A0A6P6RYY0_9EIME
SRESRNTPTSSRESSDLDTTLCSTKPTTTTTTTTTTTLTTRGSSVASRVKHWLWRMHIALVAASSLIIWEAALLLNAGYSSAGGFCLSIIAGGAAVASTCCSSVFPAGAAVCERFHAAVKQQQQQLQQDRAARAAAISQLWARAALTVGCLRPRVSGVENALFVRSRHGGPCLVVCNHCGLIDIPLTGGFLPLQHIRFVSKQEVLRWPVIGRAMREIGVVGFDRNSVAGTVRLVREMSQVVKEYTRGNLQKKTPPVFLGFPEGSRARDGRVKSPKLGLFQIAKKLGLLLLPVSIVGAHKLQPVGELLPIPLDSPVELHIHPSVDPRFKTVEEAARETWEAIIRGLPAEQRPLGRIQI